MVSLRWNVKVPFLQTKNGQGQMLVSHLFSPKETPNSKWVLEVSDKKTKITIRIFHYNAAGKCVYFEALVKMSILLILDNTTDFSLQMVSSASSTSYYVVFDFSKEEIIKWNSQQFDGSLTFYCKIFTHLKNESTSSSADPPVLAVDCSGGLSTHLDGLFNNKQFSDVILNVRGREFPAHKLILAARSKYFAAMFKHPMREQSTNQIKVEDIEPEVLQELLRFIYTGRVSTATMESMAAGLFIAADKYLLDELKMKCENHLLHHMSPENCAVLLLHGDLRNPTEPLKEAAKFFRHLPSEVMATERWEKTKKENLVLLYDIQQFVFCFK